MTPITGLVAEIQHYCIQDGPGTRTTVFLKGCPLRCKWCHNPEMISPKKEVWYSARSCTHCGRCISACPAGAISDTDGGRAINMESCIATAGCVKCGEVCSAKAIETVGREMTVDLVVDKVLEDVAFYRRSGGGTCISGGEPMLQAEFTVAFLKGCQDRMIDTAIETSCFADWETVREVAQYADLMLIDIKHMNPAAHLLGTGVSNTMILETIAKLSALGKKIRIRMPLIPEYNDSDENLRKTAVFMAENNLKYIDLLPFHLIGEYKYFKLGRDYACAGIKEPTAEKMAEHRELFDSYGLKGTIGGVDIEPF